VLSLLLKNQHRFPCWLILLTTFRLWWPKEQEITTWRYFYKPHSLIIPWILFPNID